MSADVSLGVRFWFWTELLWTFYFHYMHPSLKIRITSLLSPAPTPTHARIDPQILVPHQKVRYRSPFRDHSGIVITPSWRGNSYPRIWSLSVKGHSQILITLSLLAKCYPKILMILLLLLLAKSYPRILIILSLLAKSCPKIMIISSLLAKSCPKILIILSLLAKSYPKILIISLQ